MLLNLEQIKGIDPSSIWLEISDDEIDRSTPNPQLYPNPTGINNAKLNQLCSNKVRAYLDDRSLEHHPSFDEHQLPEIWDVVTGCGIEIGNHRLIVIPSEDIDRSELRVPQEWVDLPNWAGDYYVSIQIDLDAKLMSIWGFASHRSIKQKGRYSARNRTYSLDGDSLISDLDLLWMAEELDLEPKGILEELPTISLERALEVMQVASIPSPYSPRLAVDFAEWGAILNNPTLRAQFYLKRLQRAVIDRVPAPRFSLVDWLNREFNANAQAHPPGVVASGWQSSQSIGVLSPQHNNTILHRRGNANERGKVINLQVDLQRETVILLVGVVPEGADRMRILVRVHPAIGSRYLPPQLQLSYVDMDGVSLRTVTARSNDNYIQLPGYTCAVGMEFNIQLQLYSARSIERFIV